MNMDPGTERSLRDMPAQVARLNRSVNELTDCVKSMRDALILIALAQEARYDIEFNRMKDDFPKYAKDSDVDYKRDTLYDVYADVAGTWKDDHANL